ncbi:MAG TPA: alpha/beta hydrolase [Patescibacteria group bacterium]|nr:alpha/beta hydrolase [Patescibacteria group bacterium]
MENSEIPITPTVHKEKIERVVGTLEVTDITPKPENLKDRVPVLLIPGWAETPKTHDDTVKTIANEGRRIITIKIPRIGGVKPEGGYSEAEYTKARALVDTLNKKGIKTTDIIAHSEGALSAIIAAEIFTQESQPQRIRNIVFVEPVGLIGKDHLRNLMGRWGKMVAKDTGRFFRGSRKKNMSRAFAEAIKYAAKNPIRTLAEAGVVSASDIYKSLSDLKKNGIGVSVIHAVDDTLFPMEKVLEIAKEKGGMDTIGFYSVKGDHREISVHPEKYAVLAVNALEDIAKRSEPKP